MNEVYGHVIKSLLRGLTALELVLEQSATPQSLARILDVDRTTACRILNALAARGFALRGQFSYAIAALGISGPATRLMLDRVRGYGIYLRDLSCDFSVSSGASNAPGPVSSMFPFESGKASPIEE